MKVKIRMTLLLILFLVGCNSSETIKSSGESDNWKANMTYIVDNDGMNEYSNIEYLGNEEITEISYSIVTVSGEENGEVELEKNQKNISLGLYYTNTIISKAEAIKVLDDAYIEISWSTNNKQKTEKIEFKTK